MQSFTFYAPTEIVFGKGAEDSIADMAKKHGGNRVFLVYGGGNAVKSGLLAKIETKLKEAGIICGSFGGVRPNPRLSHTRQGVEEAISFNADMIIGIGGGSAIDAAKAIAHGAANPGTDIWQFWNTEKKLTKSLPIGTVLTIPAAGSETSASAVITNDEINQKRGLTIEYNRPKFALLNPELTLTLPKYQIACGIVDIYMHTLDRYFSNTKGNELTDEIAEALMRVVIKNGNTAIKNPDYNSMSELMWCGSISHNGMTGLGRPMEFAVHQLGHELGAKFDIPHGETLSVMWGAWAMYVYNENPERFARYAKEVWGITGSAEKTVIAGIEKTVEFFRSLDMPVCFSQSSIGIQEKSVIDDLAYRCTYAEKRLVGLFKKLNKNDLAAIYESANK